MRTVWMKLREDQVERLDGTRGIYSFVEKPTAVVIIPLEGTPQDGHVYLIEQLRYPIGKRFSGVSGWSVGRQS